ncbi:TrbC/VirB2 family protein [Brevundimonas nasdae]|uniref:TrbC/VirB2 family protein n=1 Tax=Brevundimonas nasdae TaxID=172043 RepID=UPI000A01AF00|nr:TrbC/VirB2 family protein [Brevundimonas nasdae]
MTAGSGGALGTAARWVEGLLLGPVATSLAVIAVASVGLLMLSGRINLRRGVTVVLGCFILFGAANIARGLRSALAATSQNMVIAATPAALPLPELEPPPSLETGASDPYAGASLRR